MAREPLTFVGGILVLCTCALAEPRAGGTVIATDSYSYQIKTAPSANATVDVRVDPAFVLPDDNVRFDTQWTISASGLFEFVANSQGQAVLAADGPGHVLSAHVMLQDLEPGSLRAEETLTSMVGALSNRDAGKYKLVVSGPTVDEGLEVMEYTTADELGKALRQRVAKGNPVRMAAFENSVFLIEPPLDAQRLREQFIEESATRLADVAGRLDEPPTAGQSVAKQFALGIDKLFVESRRMYLMNDKLSAYALAWQGQRPRVLATGDERIRSTEALALLDSLKLAARNTSCSVMVSTSRGFYAEVRYRKVSNPAFENFGLSGDTREVERAKYVFESYRKGMKTGEVTEDCTDRTQKVEIHEK